MKPVFKKSERLSSKKEISQLFGNGKSLFIYPFKVKYKEIQLQESRILISVPKKNLPKAVDRNLIKRRFREAYRLNKQNFINKKFDVIFIYVSKDLLTYNSIESKLLSIIHRLKE